MKRILVVYGSQKGSTKEIAETVKGCLENGRCRVDVMAAEPALTDLSGYELIVIGSGIYGAFPHNHIGEFVDRNREELEQKKTAVFAVCGNMSSKNGKKRQTAWAFADKVASGLSCQRKTVFAGRVPDFGRFINVIARWVAGTEPGDHRDWDTIKNWALSLLDLIAD